MFLPRGSGYRCFNPQNGDAYTVNEATASRFEPFASSFYRPLPPGPVSGRTLLRFAFEGSGSSLRRILGISLISSAVVLSLPVVTGVVFDHILPQAEPGQLALVCILLFVLAFANTLFNLMRGFILLRLEGRIDARVQAALWGRLLDLPASFSRHFSSGDLANRALGIQTIRQAVTGFAASSLLSGVFSLLTFVLLLIYDIKLALVALLLTLIAVAVTLLCGFLQLKHQRRLAAIAGKLSGLTLGMVNGIAKLRVAAAEPRAFVTWSLDYAQQVREELAARRVKNWMATFNALWLPLCTAFLFALYIEAQKSSLVAATASKPMSIGDLVAFLSAFGIMLGAVLSFSKALTDLVAVGPAYERARPILQTEPEARLDRSAPGTLSGALELRSVSFRYRPELPLVVRNVSLRIEPGEFVAIVGSSSSGKSTLLRLLLGFEVPESGNVLYDGCDLRILDQRAVRQQIGVVLQGGRVHAGSIFKNILGAAPLTLDDAWEAARMAGIGEDIEAMPMGMHTVLGEGGGSLSGGQCQRLLIARALVRQPRLLFFDEASSALDNITQAMVSRSLDRLQATRVVIAHRLSTIERADRIYVMQRGELVEVGKFTELMALGGVFAELAKRQVL
ncbi:MAG: NHLP bacteriocin export ABC transporter permease/ATPase subunit [Terracidiphilus sp.]